MRCYFALIFIALSAMVSLGGCALPAHNNTLVFAVNRDVGLGVSSGATDAGVNITLGYKSRELAWVPLWANVNGDAMPCYAYNRSASDSKVLPGTTSATATATIAGRWDCINGPKFVGDSEPGVGKNDAHDAYSTFASFGGSIAAKGPGAAGNATAEASGTLASFFATGVAAQKLAANPGVVNSAPSPTLPASQPEQKKAASAQPPEAIVSFLSTASAIVSSIKLDAISTTTAGDGKTGTVSIKVSPAAAQVAQTLTLCLQSAIAAAELQADQTGWSTVSPSLDSWEDKYKLASAKLPNAERDALNGVATIMNNRLQRLIVLNGTANAYPSLESVCMPKKP